MVNQSFNQPSVECPVMEKVSSLNTYHLPFSGAAGDSVLKDLIRKRCHIPL